MESPIPVSHFSDESHSFPSFPPRNRSSFESSSMKSRKSLLTLIVPSRRRVAPGNPAPIAGSKLKQASEPAENMAIANGSEIPSRRLRDNQIKTAVEQKADNVKPTPKKPLDERPQSKSRRILRAISTTFRPRLPESPASPPPASTSLQAKQNREAALRERGLLPAKDLSRQEADQDRRNPVVSLDPNSVNDSAEPSAAETIRREWESQNTTPEPAEPADARERERMKSFRFGVSPSASASSPDLSRSLHLETVAEVNTPLPSPVLDGVISPNVTLAKDAQRQASSASAGQPPPDSIFFSSAISPLPTPPTTPLKTTASANLTLSSSAASKPTPPLSSSQHGDVDHVSSSNGHDRCGSRHSTSSAPPLTNPVISLTPPGHTGSFGQSSTSSFAGSNPRRSDSLTRMPSISESSSMMPSLDNSSGSPTISTLNTTDSSSVGGRHKGRNGLLTIKMPEHLRTVPMIIESSVEDAVVSTSDVAPESMPLPISPVSQGPSPTLEVPPHHPVLTRRERGSTDIGKREKRKLFNPFKRGQSSTPSDESDRNTRRISIASLGNLKRTASNWTKARSSYDASSMAPSTMSGKAKTYDASHLPPSPKLPKHFMTSSVDTTSTGVSSQRKPLQPTLHTRASIIHEMNTIKNDEVRRMTEVAFLG